MQGGNFSGFLFPFLEDASHLVIWGSGDLGEDLTLPPTHSETLAEPCLFLGLSVPICTMVRCNWVSHSLREEESLGRRCKYGVGSPGNQLRDSGFKLRAEKGIGPQCDRTLMMGLVCKGLRGPPTLQTAPTTQAGDPETPGPR